MMGVFIDTVYDPARTRRLITQHESSEAYVYLDSGGVSTIGIGRNVDKKKKGPGLRESEIQFMLQNDVSDYLKEMPKLYKNWDELSNVRKAVLLDMRHNLGLAGLSKFKRLRTAIEAREYQHASVELLNSQWASQVGKRAKTLAQMMALDRWPW